MQNQNNQKSQLPITLGAEMLYPYFAPKPNEKIAVYARLNVFLGQAEGLGGGPIDIAYVLDASGSTTDFIDILREAAINSLELLPKESNIAGVSFNDIALTFCSLASLETSKATFVQSVDRLMSSGGTQMSSGMQLGLEELQQGTNPVRAMVIFTDGATQYDEQQCLQIAQQCKDNNIIVVAIGLCVQTGAPLTENEFNPELLEQIAGPNYEYLEKPEVIQQVFQEKVLGAAQTAITNAKLVLQPVQWTEIQEGSLALPSYMAATNPVELPVGEVQVEKETAALVKLSATLPEDVASGKAKSFARISLVGDIPSQGIAQQELARTNTVMRFSDDARVTDRPNLKVAELVRIVAAAKDLDAAAKASTAQEAQQKLAMARRKTQAFSNQEAAAALMAQINAIQQDVDAGDLQRAQQKAAATGRKTAAFSQEDAAETLKKMLGGEN